MIFFPACSWFEIRWYRSSFWRIGLGVFWLRYGEALMDLGDWDDVGGRK